MKMLLVMAVALFSSASFAAVCQDGNVQYWPSQANDSSTYGGQGAPNVAWVCEGGKYVEVGAVTAPVTHRTCTEGQIEMFPDDSGAYGSSFGGQGAPNVPFICHSGVFVNQYHPQMRQHTKAARCPEGRTEQFTTASEGGPTVVETYICKNGSMKLVRKTSY